MRARRRIIGHSRPGTRLFPSPSMRYAPSLKYSLAAQSIPSSTSLPRLVPGGFDCAQDEIERFAGRSQRRRKAALVADRGRKAGLVKRALQRVENLRPAAQRLGEGRSAGRKHHEFLEVDAVVRVNAAVEDVHLRQGKQVRIRAAEIAIERHSPAHSPRPWRLRGSRRGSHWRRAGPCSRCRRARSSPRRARPGPRRHGRSPLWRSRR